MKLESLVGISLGINSVNGKMKPKFGKKVIVSIIFFAILEIIFIFGFVYFLININIENIIIFGAGALSIIYFLLISPYTQNSKNYYIEFNKNDSKIDFKLSYKGKLVDIKHKIDNDGKICFSNNSSKLSCISYADNSKMSNFTKYKIINYFTKWLSDNDLLSNSVTVTFEEL